MCFISGTVTFQALVQSMVPVIPFVFLVGTRISVVFASLPAPFGNGGPMQVRMAVVLALTFAMCTPFFADPPLIPIEPVAIGVAMVGEVLVGAVIGLTVRVTLAAGEIAGELAGLSMGQGFAQSIDPTVGEMRTPAGRLLGSITILLFLLLQGHHVFLAALSMSLQTAPVGRAFAHINYDHIINMASGLLAQGLRIASPVMATMFIVYLGMGLIARSAPKVQIFILTFAITSAAGTVVVYASMPAMAEAMAQHIQLLPELLGEAIRRPR